MSFECVLKSVDDAHDPIPLPHQTPTTVGRSKVTRIEDEKLSRKQVQLTADCDRGTVTCIRLGPQASCIDDSEMTRGDKIPLKPTQILSLYKRQYHYAVEIQWKDKNTKHKIESLKRSSSSGDKSSAKRHKTEDSESSDDENVAAVQQKLANMRKMLAKSENTSAEPTGKAAEHKVTERSSSAMSSYVKDKLLVLNSENLKDSSKIASFDIDNTIICTQSGKVFPQTIQDWKLMLPEVAKKLKSLHADGYKIVFFTNQSGIQRGRLKVEDFKKKLLGIIEKIGVPVQVFTATGHGPFRKPGVGMWNYLQDHENGGIAIDMKNSFYIGDAAGRPVKWAPGRKKDFACSDRLFALNIGVEFQTPEEFFLKYRKAEFVLPEFDPRKLKSDAPLCTPSTAEITKSKLEVVVFVGYPASGKSFFAKSQMASKGYHHVNRDMLGSWQKCVSACEQSLKRGRSVVIDNTNPDIESRHRYISLAQSIGCGCRCFKFAATLQQCKHNERYREMTDSAHKPINDMIMNSFKSKLSEPKLSEGFTEIVTINFVPKFNDKRQEKFFRMFLT